MAKEKIYTMAGDEARLGEMKALEEAIEKNKKDISTARSFGDLSENIEYTEGDIIAVGIYVKCAGPNAWGKIDDAMLNSER